MQATNSLMECQFVDINPSPGGINLFQGSSLFMEGPVSASVVHICVQKFGSYDDLTREFADALDAVVVSIEYGPSYPHFRYRSKAVERLPSGLFPKLDITM